MKYSVKQLAELAGVSVRALHHYDAIGLLVPDRDEKTDYRIYTDEHVRLLLAIKLMKQAGMSLEEIAQKVSSKYFDVQYVFEDLVEVLESERGKLDELILQLKQYSHMDIDTIVQAHKDVGFDEKTAQGYAEEAYMRWGNTDAYKQSAQRLAKMSKEELQVVKQNGECIMSAIAEKMDKDVSDEVVQTLIGEYHVHMETFYDVDAQTFTQLGEMYVADPRFKKTFEDIKPGLAAYMRDAMKWHAEHAM